MTTAIFRPRSTNSIRVEIARQKITGLPRKQFVKHHQKKIFWNFSSYSGIYSMLPVYDMIYSELKITILSKKVVPGFKKRYFIEGGFHCRIKPHVIRPKWSKNPCLRTKLKHSNGLRILLMISTQWRISRLYARTTHKILFVQLWKRNHGFNLGVVQNTSNINYKSIV